MILDGLTFVGDSLMMGQVTATDLARELDGAGIDRAVVCPLKPRNYRFRPANEYVARAVEAYPARMIGFARVDPHLGEEAADELRDSVERLGLQGLFLHPWEETFRANAPVVEPILRVAAALGVPVIVATGYPWLAEGTQVGALAAVNPEVPIIATNGAQMNISGFGQDDAEFALRAAPNLRIHTTGVYREDFLQGVDRTFGPARMLFASAFPYFEVEFELLRVTAAHLPEQTKAKILGTNLHALLESAKAVDA